MTRYNVGDTLTLENDHGDRLVREVQANGTLDGPLTRDMGVDMLVCVGYKITSVTPKLAPLPPGWYVDENVGLWGFDGEHWNPVWMSGANPEPTNPVRLIPESTVAEAKQEAYSLLLRLLPIGEKHTDMALLAAFARELGLPE